MLTHNRFLTNEAMKNLPLIYQRLTVNENDSLTSASPLI